jgi:hypothetical protein
MLVADVALPSKLRIREIGEADLDAVGDLLTRGFVNRSREWWMRGLHRQTTRPVPAGCPRYGYMLEGDGVPVGCLLLIGSSRTIAGRAVTRCNVSSWYVEPEFRIYAAMFASMTQKPKSVTYFNVSPGAETWPILEAQGFQVYCRGTFCSVPALSRKEAGMTIERIDAATNSVSGLSDVDAEILRRHAEYGCVSLFCRTTEHAYPFIFFPVPRRRGPVRSMLLGYCNSISDYVRCAGAIGRYLLWRGKPLVIIDANGPVAGLAGVYREGTGRKYFKGPHRISLGDLADTELAIFGW